MASTMRRSSNGSTIGGRTSSQISIYDYPEHLNPFHEEDQHKRLRFWKMSTGNADRKRDRSNSFSLTGLKEMWAFKSFRPKKRSSMLGVNKTSESPPQLRRNAPSVEVPLFESRIRHTVDADAMRAFDRGAGYRSSLQNVHSNGNQTLDAGAFRRNDRLRSTALPASNGFHTMHARGSVTPTPVRTSALAHGLSQSSLNSTNPFDEDDDAPEISYRTATDIDDDTVSRVTVNVVNDGMGGTRKVYRKKRRAPPPPPPRTSSIPPANDTTASENPAHAGQPTANGSQSIIQTVLTETSRENSTEDDETDISQLAAQIASFVQTADTDRADIRTTTTVKTVETETTINEKPLNTVQSVSAIRSSVASEHRAAQAPRSPAPVRRALPASARDSPENNAAYPLRNGSSPSRTPTPTAERTPPAQSSAAEVQSEKQLNTDPSRSSKALPRIIVRSPTADDGDSDAGRSASIERQPLPAVPPATEIVRVVSRAGPQTAIVQHIPASESEDDPPVEPKSPTDADRYKIRFVALRPASLKSNGNPVSNTDKPATAQRNSSISRRRSDQPPVVLRQHLSTDDDDDDDECPTGSAVHAPPRRRRSVKDIIESINKSQSLLRVNQSNGDADPMTVDQRVVSLEQIDNRLKVQQQPSPPAATPSNESIVRNLNELQAHELQIRQTIFEMEQSQKQRSDPNNNSNGHSDSLLSDDALLAGQLPLMVERYAEFSSEFRKCGPSAATSSPLLPVRRRDKSVAGSSRMDWNPLPKPRRSTVLTPEHSDASDANN